MRFISGFKLKLFKDRIAVVNNHERKIQFYDSRKLEATKMHFKRFIK